MLDQKDLQVLQNMMEQVFDTRIAESEKKMEQVIDTRIAESEKKMEQVVTQSENLILEELKRTRNILEQNINAVQKNVDELNQYYRITKLENDNTSLLLKMTNDLSKRLEEVERRTDEIEKRTA